MISYHCNQSIQSKHRRRFWESSPTPKTTAITPNIESNAAIVTYIGSTLNASQTAAKEDDLSSNHTNAYTIKLFNVFGGNK